MYSSTHSLTSALKGGEWLAARPCRFTHKERAPDTHWIGGWVGPRLWKYLEENLNKILQLHIIQETNWLLNVMKQIKLASLKQQSFSRISDKKKRCQHMFTDNTYPIEVV
jgi:hypothetical protein